MKRILHISKYYLPYYGGIEQVAYDIVSGLNDEYEQMVICFNHEKGSNKGYYNDILVHRVYNEPWKLDQKNVTIRW